MSGMAQLGPAPVFDAKLAIDDVVRERRPSPSQINTAIEKITALKDAAWNLNSYENKPGKAADKIKEAVRLAKILYTRECTPEVLVVLANVVAVHADILNTLANSTKNHDKKTISKELAEGFQMEAGDYYHSAGDEFLAQGKNKDAGSAFHEAYCAFTTQMNLLSDLGKYASSVNAGTRAAEMSRKEAAAINPPGAK